MGPRRVLLKWDGKTTLEKLERCAAERPLKNTGMAINAGWVLPSARCRATYRYAHRQNKATDRLGNANKFLHSFGLHHRAQDDLHAGRTDPTLPRRRGRIRSRNDIGR